MKKMRKYSGATGIQTVPNVPSTFVPKSSPHFVAALSGKGQEHPQRKTSVYRSAATTNPQKKHSTVFRSTLPMIQVTTGEVEAERNRHVQREESSSTGSSWTSVGLDLASDTSEKYKTASNPTEKQRKISVKERVLLGETPLGKDMLFRRKISNTAATPKIINAEEKERLLMKYTPLINSPTSDHSNNKQMKSTYFSRYNIPTDAGKSSNISPLLSKGSRASELYANYTRGRAQSLNFVPSADIRIKEKTTKKVFGSETFPADSITRNVYSRDRAQTLNFVIQGGEMGSAGSAKMRLLKGRTKGLYQITEEMRKQNQRTVTKESNNLQIEPANNLSASLFLYSQNASIENAFEGKLSPIRDKMNIKLPRQDSQDRNAFLIFPTLRAKSWIEN